MTHADYLRTMWRLSVAWGEHSMRAYRMVRTELDVKALDSGVKLSLVK